MDDIKAVYSVLNSLAEGVVVADRNGEFRYFNPVAERILGIGMQDISQEDWSSVYGCYHPDQVTPFASDRLPLARAIQGEVVNEEVLFIRNPERPEGIFISVTASPLFDDAGEINGGTVVFRDLTEKRRREKEIQQLFEAVEQTADSVVITDRAGNITYVNSAFETTTGFRRKEVVGKSPSLLKSGTHPREFYQQMWETILRGEFYRGTLVNRKKNGETYWCEQTITPMKDADSRITHFVSVARDITERMARQEQKARLQVAREIQRRLYPHDLSVPGIEVAGASHSADETNGDYFDYFTSPAGEVFVILGDVCGHGVGAALIMAQTRAFLHAFLQVDSDPGRVLTRANAQLASDLDPQHYVTLVLVRIDPQDGSLVYASGGHPPAFLLRQDGTIGETLGSTGIPLGFLPEQVYETSRRIDLAVGDTLVFLTDGVLETLADEDIELGVERALDIVRRHQERAPVEILEHLIRSVLEFRQDGAPEDDITSIICRIKEVR